MARSHKILLVGLATGALGVLLSAASTALSLEERFGLPLLFSLRGAVEPPAEVLVVALDKESADRFGLPPEPAKWPRTLAATLVDRLREAEAAVIVFDVVFEEARPEEQDTALEEAIRKAGSVVLCEWVKQDVLPVDQGGGHSSGSLALRQIVGPLPRFARAALALAPFPLPKVPVSVSQYWLSKAELGDKPTLPVVALQVYGLSVYDRFHELLRSLRPDEAERLPRTRSEVAANREVVQVIRSMRRLFRGDPRLAEEMLLALDGPMSSPARPTAETRLLRSLIQMLRGPDSHYLRFYGPPGSFPSVSAHRLIFGDAEPLAPQLSGKVVFVGVARHRTADQQDDFFTVFSRSSGIDLTGVEIAATAFSNLLEDRPVRPLSFAAHQALIFAWGMISGVLCYGMRTRFAIPALSVLWLAYLSWAVYAFKVFTAWAPLVVPLGMQSPFAFWHGLFWRHRDTLRERRNIQEAFGYFLPKSIVAQLAEDVSSLRDKVHVATGVCLCTDGEQYAALAERCGPAELIRFLNDYYETIFPLVQRHGGRVSDIIGDSMLAVWAGDAPPGVLRERACLAALDIARAVDRFNQAHDSMRLPTRIGLSFGPMSFGHIGGADHYEYRPVGDTVNMASRIEGLNKALSTRILVAENVLDEVIGLRARELGRFLLAGKSVPVTVHELLCHTTESSALLNDLCDAFGRGLEAYRKRDWESARFWLEKTLAYREDDGPARFYLSLCAQLVGQPPEEAWDGSIAMGKG